MISLLFLRLVVVAVVLVVALPLAFARGTTLVFLLEYLVCCARFEVFVVFAGFCTRTSADITREGIS